MLKMYPWTDLYSIPGILRIIQSMYIEKYTEDNPDNWNAVAYKMSGVEKGFFIIDYTDDMEIKGVISFFIDHDDNLDTVAREHFLYVCPEFRSGKVLLNLINEFKRHCTEANASAHPGQIKRIQIGCSVGDIHKYSRVLNRLGFKTTTIICSMEV